MNELGFTDSRIGSIASELEETSILEDSTITLELITKTLEEAIKLELGTTTLEEDVALMRETSYNDAGGGEALMTALEYRFAKKSLLAQASGVQSSNFAFAMR